MVSTVLGWVGVLLSIPVWAYFLYRALKLVRFIASGGPTTTSRFNNWGQRLVRVIVEVFGHTHFKGKPLVNAAHWAVMVGFLFGIVVWFEAYIQTFNPAGGWPILSDWNVYHFVEEVLAVATIVGILFLVGVRLKLGDSERGSRFYNSVSWHAYLIEAIVFVEGLGMLMVKAAKIATYGGNAPWADFISGQIAKLLPASPALVSAFALVKLLGGLLFVIFVSRTFNAGVAWHRFAAFFTIFFQRNPEGAKALGALPTPTLDDEDITLPPGRCCWTPPPAPSAAAARNCAPRGTRASR